MPTYRYRCTSCNKYFELVMSYQEYGINQVLCIHCGSNQVERRIERIRVMKDDAARLQQMADPEALAGIENDPRAMGKMMRDMEHQIGQDMGAEFDEVVDRLESGQTARQIENELPDISVD